jgi:uncharacterized protein YfaT (DUF1175 family)
LYIASRRRLGALLAMSSVIFAGCSGSPFRDDQIGIEPKQVILPADGRIHSALRIRSLSGHSLRVDEIQATGSSLRLTESGNAGLEGLLQSPVVPGESKVHLRWRSRNLTVPVSFVLDPTDSYGDGTPDFLRLHTAEDQKAFRDWFTLLAERAAEQPPDKLPPEIDDCAALLRYSYREALRSHDEQWLAGQDNEGSWAIPSVRQYQYPETPLGSSLFRVRPGSFIPGDLKDGSFAQFADARTLMTLNMHFISHNLDAARPGDLIFYRQLEQNSPYHSMIVGQHADWVVYHTGPIGRSKGEMRRVTIEDLLHHPDARWRPSPVNSNFLGVYRWNILRDTN